MMAAEERSLILYHGTDGANAASILASGLKASPDGRLGAGVYFTDSEIVAQTIAKSRGLQSVVTCKVRISSVMDSDITGNYKSWHGTHSCAKSMHPPWAGVTHRFQEYCVHDTRRIEVFAFHGFVAPPPQSLPFPVNDTVFYVVNVGHSMFLDTHGSNVQVWGDGVNIGTSPRNIQWRFRAVAGTVDTYYIINEGHFKYLDTHGAEVTVWGNGRDTGQRPENIQWTLRPVPGEDNTFYIVNIGHRKFLDTHGNSVSVWGNGVDTGRNPANIQWHLRRA
jgi:hypothetical protein